MRLSLDEPSSGFSCDMNQQPMLGPWRNAVEAALWLTAGMALCALFSLPLASSLTDFAAAVNVGAFPIAFVAVPLLLLSNEVPAWLELAGRRRRRHASAVLTQVG